MKANVRTQRAAVRKRGQQSEAEDLAFAVQFAGMDLDHLRPGDWLNLRDDFSKFLAFHSVEGPGYRDCPEDDFRAIQRDLNTLLRDVVTSRDTHRLSPTFVPIHVRISLFCMPAQGPFPEQTMRQACGPMRDLFILRVRDLLLQAPTLEPIRQCPECERIFLRVRKQEYCSRACVNRASVRRWRQTEAGKQYEQARSHTRYEKRRKRESGNENLKVARRPRKGKGE